MYGWHDMSGWGWFFGSVMMLGWIVVLALAVHVAVKLVQGDRDRRTPPH